MKKILNILVITLISVIVLPFSVNAANITSLDVKNNNGTLTVSGTTESDVHAIAILVYSNEELVHMETCSNDGSYTCKLNKSFDNGTYTVKVADYDGGNYVTKEVKVEISSTKDDNPETYDNIIIYEIAGSISLIGLAAFGLHIRKKTN